MANKNFRKKKIEETEGGNFGQYQEGVGGGASPNGPAKPGTHGHGVNSDYRDQNNDTKQARTKDGKFTYKSVNGKSIDPKYGPSRGKTVNPLLTGGENGVYIDDVVDSQGNKLKEGVSTQFANKSGAYWNKYKDKWYTKGGEIVTSGDFKVRVAGATIWDVAKRRYDSVKGEFEFESETFNETKKGRTGIEEKAAKQKAQATGEEQAVIEQSSGGIKLKPGAPALQPGAPTVQGQKPQPGANIGATPVIPTSGANVGQQPQPVNTANASDITNADYSPKYDDNDIAEVRTILQEQGFTDDELADFDAMSPKEKDDFIDKNFDVNSEEEETEDTQKVKDMGFNE